MNTKILAEQLKEFDVKTDYPLAKETTWKVGGKADLFIEAKTIEDLIKYSDLSRQLAVPVTILGWGSNVLISDSGIRGLVIKNKSNKIDIKGECQEQRLPELKSNARLGQIDTANYYSFDDIDYQEGSSKRISVKVDSGVSLQLAINTLIAKGVTGLQWFSGIPGTIGGAIYNNIHGGSHFIEEYVSSVTVITTQGQVTELTAQELEFDYDMSRFHHSKEIILTVDLCLYDGDKDKARQASIAWAQKKKLQPHNTAGCCFQNLTQEQQRDLNLESNSWGYIIDQILKLKGTKIGGAQISPKHAAFIENTGNATAADIVKLFQLIHDQSIEKLGIAPKAEIVFLGFDATEIEKFT